MHRNAHHERHRGSELIDEPALAGGSWSEDYYCRMDERFCAALSRAIADGKEHMPEPPRLRSIARQGS
jgi:hypothetical protein